MSTEASGYGLLSIAKYVPEHVRTNDFWGDDWRERYTSRVQADVTAGVDKAVQDGRADVDPEVARGTTRWAHDLFRGAYERRVMREDELSSEMETAAAERAIARAGIEKSAVDAYYGYSTVPDEIEPQNHCLVHHMLGLREETFAATLASGCATFLPMIMTASRMAQVGEHSHSVICVSGAMSKCTDYGYPGSVNVGDAAVAGVVGKVDDGHGYIGHIQRSRGDLHRGIVMLPEGKPDIPWWQADLHKGRFYATNDDRKATHIMGARSATLCKEACHEVLDLHGYNVEDVDFICLPQSASWFGQALAEAVGLGDPSKWVPYEDHYKKFGHCVVASLPLNVCIAWETGRLKKGDLLLMYGAGAGFTQAATLYRWNLDPPAR